MWSSTLPTGTVRNEGRSSRTYPQSTAPPDSPATPPEKSDRTADRRQHSRAELLAEIDRLQAETEQADAEIRRLESQVDQLRSQLDDRHQAQQAMVDQYEAIITELEAAAATAPNARTARKKQGLLGRLKDGLF